MMVTFGESLCSHSCLLVFTTGLAIYENTQYIMNVDIDNSTNDHENSILGHEHETINMRRLTTKMHRFTMKMRLFNNTCDI